METPTIVANENIVKEFDVQTFSNSMAKEEVMKVLKHLPPLPGPVSPFLHMVIKRAKEVIVEKYVDTFKCLVLHSLILFLSFFKCLKNMITKKKVVQAEEVKVAYCVSSIISTEEIKKKDDLGDFIFLTPLAFMILLDLYVTMELT